MGGGKQTKNSGQLTLEEGKVGTLSHRATTLDGRDLEQLEQDETRTRSDDLFSMTCAQLSWDLGPKIRLVLLYLSHI